MILDPTNQKFVKVQFFTNSFFQNMLLLYHSRFKRMRLNDERKKNQWNVLVYFKLRRNTLTQKVIKTLHGRFCQHKYNFKRTCL